MTSIGYTYNEDPIPEILCEKPGTLPNQKELDKLRSAANDSVDKLPCSHLFSTTVLQRIATVGVMELFSYSTIQKIQSTARQKRRFKWRAWSRFFQVLTRK